MIPTTRFHSSRLVYRAFDDLTDVETLRCIFDDPASMVGYTCSLPTYISSYSSIVANADHSQEQSDDSVPCRRARLGRPSVSCEVRTQSRRPGLASMLTMMAVKESSSAFHSQHLSRPSQACRSAGCIFKLLAQRSSSTIAPSLGSR